MSDLKFRRGDVVIGVFGGDTGKPRPAIVVQADPFNDTHSTAVLCPISPEVTGLSLFRVTIPASDATGLRNDSEIMVDKVRAIERRRIRQRIGQLSGTQLKRVDAALRVWLNLPETI